MPRPVQRVHGIHHVSTPGDSRSCGTTPELYLTFKIAARLVSSAQTIRRPIADVVVKVSVTGDAAHPIARAI